MYSIAFFETLSHSNDISSQNNKAYEYNIDYKIFAFIMVTKVDMGSVQKNSERLLFSNFHPHGKRNYLFLFMCSFIINIISIDIFSLEKTIGTYAPSLFDSPLEPWSTVCTLIFVLLVTSVKEGMEDLQRAKADRVGKREILY